MPNPSPQHIARYALDGAVHFGRRDGDAFRRMTAAPWEGGRETGAHDRIAAVRLLAPVTPTKIVCVGLNYRAHIEESVTGQRTGAPAEPLLFLKPPSAVLAGGEAIR